MIFPKVHPVHATVNSTKHDYTIGYLLNIIYKPRNQSRIQNSHKLDLSSEDLNRFMTSWASSGSVLAAILTDNQLVHHLRNGLEDILV